MSDNTARTESFIMLLLQVTGKARPSDLVGMSAEEAASHLSSFAAAHPEMGVRMDGDTLVEGVAPAPAASTEVAPAPETAVGAVGVAAGAGAANPDLPEWVYEQSGEAAPAAPSEYGMPAPVPTAAEYGAPTEYGTPSPAEYGAPAPAAPTEYGIPSPAEYGASAPEFDVTADPAPTGLDFEPMPEAAQPAADGFVPVPADAMPEPPVEMPADDFVIDVEPEPKKRQTQIGMPILIALVVVVVGAAVVAALYFTGILFPAPAPSPAPAPAPVSVPASGTPEATESAPASPAP